MIIKIGINSRHYLISIRDKGHFRKQIYIVFILHIFSKTLVTKGNVVDFAKWRNCGIASTIFYGSWIHNMGRNMEQVGR